MGTILFLFKNMIKQAIKGDWNEAFDAWCWISFHIWYGIRGKVRRIK